VARALAGPHTEGVAHGAVPRALVHETLVDDSSTTLLVSGQAPPPPEHTPAHDLEHLLTFARALAPDAALDPPPAALASAPSLAAWAAQELTRPARRRA
jgi:hypothetical protein